MVATKEGRSDQRKRTPRGKEFSLRFAILLVCVAIGFVFVLSSVKERSVDDYAQECFGHLSDSHQEFRNLFQGYFFFNFKETFLPGIEKNIELIPGLKQVYYLKNNGSILFDSNRPELKQNEETYPSKDITSKLTQITPSVFVKNYQIHILMPSGQFAVLYVFDGSFIRSKIIKLFVLGLLAAIALLLFVRWFQRLGSVKGAFSKGRRYVGLHVEFLLTIVLINSITGAIIYFHLSELQTEEETARIRKQSILFSRFSTDKVISDFSQFFYFYYRDKFLPSINTVIATNENVVGIKIISERNLEVLFDSETASSGPVPIQSGRRVLFKMTDTIREALKSRGYETRFINRDNERLLSVVNAFRNENQETRFIVEYLFSFRALDKSIAGIRRQILLDLIPSMILGFFIAVLFGQFLISPIRRLAKALQRVSKGDYEVSLDVKRSDEIGELLESFNLMTFELRKKKELKKYLSDSTYRQVMAAPESPEGNVRLKGSRVNATILFSDIRDFVSHCENLDAEEVTGMLNEYFSEMVEVVHKYGGEVDKFIGDALLAVFYESKDELDTLGISSESSKDSKTSLRAIYCALEMREKLRDFNAKRIEQKKRKLEIGVGIAYGEIISGPIGAKDRMDFTVIGDVVNTANRIEKVSKLGRHTRIVFSNVVEERIRGLLEYEKVAHEPIRGKEEEVQVFELIRVKDLESLLENMRSEDLSVRLRSIELLGQSRNPSAIPSLIEELQDENAGVRIASVESLIKLSAKDDPQVVDALFERLSIEKSDKVVSSIISAIGRMCSTEKILDLEPFLESRDDRIVANVVEALAQARLPQATDLIVPKLGSRNNRVKANSAMALFSAGHVGVIDNLKPMLLHSDPYMRSSAAFAIGELARVAQGDALAEQWQRQSGQEVKLLMGEFQECVPMLVSLLRDSQVMVKKQAVIALGKIKDKSAVLPIIDSIDIEKDPKSLLEDIAVALSSIGSHRLVREVLEKMG